MKFYGHVTVKKSLEESTVFLSQYDLLPKLCLNSVLLTLPAKAESLGSICGISPSAGLLS